MKEQDEILEMLSEINERFKKISDVLTSYSLLILEDGWFFDYRIPISSHFQNIAKYDKVIFNLYMEKHFEDNIDKIEELAVKRFPKREKIIRKAIKSHKNGDYEVSIPVLISQADGIFREMTKKEFYSKRTDVKAENIIDEIKNEKFKEFSLWILEPLKKTQLISANFKESKDTPDFLHRNPILHGEDSDYANIRNGAKSLSLLNYIIKVVYDLYFSTDMTELKDFVMENSK
ncbi:hypothetical protein [uncultured Draconibacterium sp.]|uniref:hypothetical protein n=1 Tax=uncultured Draconibacterium sp. TaxID=1573823 RepID=UPI0029C97F1D|nr:hypothetical protein [uncultured Draconibacterium sp.]